MLYTTTHHLLYNTKPLKTPTIGTSDNHRIAAANSKTYTQTIQSHNYKNIINVFVLINSSIYIAFPLHFHRQFDYGMEYKILSNSNSTLIQGNFKIIL